VGTFTVLDDDDMAAIAGAFGLGAVARWRAIAAGTINSNFELDTAADRYFVRVNEGKSEDDVAWEGDLVAHLAAAGVPSPVPLTASGERYLRHRGHLISAFPHLPGDHRAPTEVSEADAAQVGAALARIHRAGDDFAGARRIGIYTWPHIRERFAGFREHPDTALGYAIGVLAAEMAIIDARAAEREAAPRGIIHGDLFRDNVLFAAGRLTALLDFEQASEGAPVYDLAVALNDWCWDGAPHPERAAALLAGYQEVRPLTAEERSILPIELRAAAVRFTVTRITDVHLPGIPNPDKDFRAFLARVEAWRDGGAEVLLAALHPGAE